MSGILYLLCNDSVYNALQIRMNLSKITDEAIYALG